MLIEITSRGTGGVLFRAEADSLRLALEAAVKSGADLREANLRGTNLGGTNLRGANLRGADLREVNLRGANLDRADLGEADLDGANLRGANLYRADLGEADLYGVNLRGADLYGANLYGANLYEADLDGADLRGANLRGANGLNPYLCTPLLLLRDQPGAIRAYKLVTADGYGPFNGGLCYRVGGTVEVDDANTDVAEACAAGINLATLDWCMKEWRPGYRILIAEFTAADIAAIPTATDGKFRVHRCTIVEEVDLTTIGVVASYGEKLIHPYDP